MILVDTSVWIDHLHTSQAGLVALLEDNLVACHPSVIEELALGSIKQRDRVLSLLGNLRQFPVLTHEEAITLIAERRLWGRGLSAVDVHLLGSVLLLPRARLWTRDRRLVAACRDHHVPYFEEPEV